MSSALILFMSILGFSALTHAAQPANGFYQRPCYVVDTDALTTELTINGNKWDLQHLAYEDEKCEKAYLIYEVNYKVKAQNEKDIDMTTVEVSYTTLSNEVTKALNMVRYCGFDDWKTKAKKVVTGKVCDEFNAPQAGAMIYSIVDFKQNGELYIGTTSGTADGKTPESRHDQVDSLPFKKIR